MNESPFSALLFPLHSTLLHSIPLRSILPHSTPLHSTLHSTLLHSTPLHSIPLHSTPLHPVLFAPFHSTTPHHTTPHHSIPFQSTPLHSTSTLFFSSILLLRMQPPSPSHTRYLDFSCSALPSLSQFYFSSSFILFAFLSPLLILPLAFFRQLLSPLLYPFFYPFVPLLPPSFIF